MSRPQAEADTPARLLARAALDGDLERVRELVAQGADAEMDSASAADVLRTAENDNSPNARLRTGLLETLVLHQQHGHINAAMYLSAYNGFENIVDYFLQKDTANDLTLNVALFAAARSGRTALAEKLIDAGAQPDFKKGLPLRAAIDSGKEETVQMLLKRGSPRAEGLIHAASRGDMSMTVLLIERSDDIRPALEKICHSLSDTRALPPNTGVQDLTGVADMLLALAEARGDDMAAHLTWLSFTAVREKSPALMETIVLQPRFADISAQDRRDLFDVLTPFLQTPQGKASFGDVQRSKDALLHAGGAQAVLYAGIQRGDQEWVKEALHAGADPRRERAKALRLASEKSLQNQQNQSQRLILQNVQQAITAASILTDGHTSKTLTAEDFTAALRVRDDIRGTTGLMSVIDSGKAPALGALLQKKDVLLTAEDFLAADPRGFSALDRLEDHKQQDWLFSRSLWQGQPKEYAKLWDALPAHWKTDYAEKHADLIAALDVESGLQHLRSTAEAHDFRLPQRRKNAPLKPGA